MDSSYVVDSSVGILMHNENNEVKK